MAHAYRRCARSVVARSTPSSNADAETQMRPRCDLNLGRMCITPQILACSIIIEPSWETQHLQQISARSCQALKADDGSRTRDLRLGKPTLYQLSYVRE